ncbi:MAG: hypothetical protein JW795_18375, partial [Chitinivibrionales bacterium]|nr:hypothetical protein [Chitinivibrionales bacterium]
VDFLTAVIVNLTNIPDTTYAINPLKQNFNYYWRVRAHSGPDSSVWSEVWSLTTVPPPPQMVMLLSPVNNAENVVPRSQLCWNRVADAVDYKVEVSLVENFSQVSVIDTVTDTTFTVPRDLKRLQKHFWRVTGRNAGGWGIISAVWSFTTIIDAPSIPSLVSPAPNEDSVRLPVRFVWNKATNGQSYRIQITKGTMVSSRKELDSTKIMDTTLIVQKLDYNQKYYWRVKSLNIADSSGWSSYQKFTTIFAPPQPPQLLQPAQASVNVQRKVTFTWKKSLSAQFYSIQIATDSQFIQTSLFFTKDTVNDTTITLDNLAFATTYFWRVKSRNTINDSDIWSNARYFTTLLQPPMTPVLASPANNAVNQLLGPALVWNAAAGATSYRVQLSMVENFASLIIDQSAISATTLTVAANLLANYASYFWRVNATNGIQTSDWSSVWTFKTIPLKPQSPQLLLPYDNVVNQPVELVLSWNAVSGADSFSIQVATAASFDPATLVLAKSGVTTTSYGLTKCANFTTYYWRVNAVNAAGVSDWSAIRRFTTIVAPPAKTTLLLPANGGVNQPLQVNVSWNPVAHSASYNLQVASDRLFSQTSLIIDKTGITGVSFPVTGLSYQKSYYWRVSAVNISGAGAWSDAWIFTTVIGPPQVPILLFPANGTQNLPLAPSLIWNASNNALTYTIQIATQSNFTDASLIVNQDVKNSTTFIPVGLKNATTYFWRLNAINNAGVSQWSSPWSFTVASTAISTDKIVKTPLEFTVTPSIVKHSLDQVAFVGVIPQRSRVEIVVFDPLGTVVFHQKQHGVSADKNGPVTLARWDLRAQNRKRISSGAYRAVLKVTNATDGTSMYAKTNFGVKN